MRGGKIGGSNERGSVPPTVQGPSTCGTLDGGPGTGGTPGPSTAGGTSDEESEGGNRLSNEKCSMPLPVSDTDTPSEAAEPEPVLIPFCFTANPDWIIFQAVIFKL